MNNLYANVGNCPYAGIGNGMISGQHRGSKCNKNLSHHYSGSMITQGVLMSNKGYKHGTFRSAGKGYILEDYGAFSISAAVRGPYQQPPTGGLCRCGNACGCNCAYGNTKCKCPYLQGVS